jgi:hypothetical protein
MDIAEQSVNELSFDITDVDGSPIWDMPDSVIVLRIDSLASTRQHSDTLLQRILDKVTYISEIIRLMFVSKYIK